MIKKVSSSDLELNSFQSKVVFKSSKMITSPGLVSTFPSNYSSENIKANYMPISFKGKEDAYGKKQAKEAASVQTKKAPKVSLNKNFLRIMVSDLPQNAVLQGNYYNQLSDDVAVLLGSDKYALLVKDKDVEPELFVHNFARNFKEGKYAGSGLKIKNSDVVYINDPVMALKELVGGMFSEEFGTKPSPKTKETASKSVISMLSELSLKDKKQKIIFINDFETFINANKASSAKTVKNYFSDLLPGVFIVGMLKKETVDAMDEAVKNKPASEHELYGVKKLPLEGLNTDQAVDFFKNNPNLIKNILGKYKQTNLSISPNGVRELVELSSKAESSLPNSALEMLKLVASAKVNETKMIFAKPNLTISSSDVIDFSRNHSQIVEGLKPKAGRFNIAENVSTRLTDVGGISTIKDDIDDLVSFLRNPKTYEGKPPKGILLEGDPGTGKTLLARAIAGESRTPFFKASGSEFVEMYVGTGAARVRELFANAKKAAEKSPNKTAIIFIDEFDALAKTRSSGGHNDERESTLNQFLVEMDGFDNKESKTKIIMIAATNRRDTLDSAAIRQGRFDDIFTIPNPSTDADRLEILNIHAKKIKFENEAEKAKILEQTSRITDGMSPAEMAGVMQKAQKVVQRRKDNKFMTYNDVVEGFLQVEAGPKGRGINETPLKDIIKTVRHEGGHAVVMDALQSHLGEKISFITLNPRGDFLGAVFHNGRKTNYDFKSVIVSAASSYAGGLAEPEYKVSGYSAGVRGDAEHATRIIGKAITEWTLGVNTPPLSMKVENEDGSVNKFSEYLLSRNGDKIDKDMKLFSTTAKKIAQMLIDFHKDFLDEYVNRFEKNVGKGGCDLSGEEFRNLRQAWLAKTGKTEQEKQLLKKIDNILDAAYNSNKDIFTKTFKKITRVLK